MKEFNVVSGNGRKIVHFEADNGDYVVTYDNGQLTFESESRRYILPSGVGDQFKFFGDDPNTGKTKYLADKIRTLYRDATHQNFGGNITGIQPGTIYYTDELTIGGLTEPVPVYAKNGATIYKNGNPVSNGITVNNGDLIKFKVTSSFELSTSINFDLSIGDITNLLKITTTSTDATLHNEPLFNDDFDDNILHPFWGLNTDYGTGSETGGKLQLTTNIYPDAWKGVSTTVENYRMTGDFDISVTIDMTGCIGNNDTPQAQIRFYDQVNTFTMGGMKEASISNIYAWTSDTNASGSYIKRDSTNFINSMKYRMTRVGSVVTSYYDRGSGWVVFSSGNVTSTDVAIVQLWLYVDASGSTANHVATFDDFYSSGLWINA